jgi:hypothetical protein
MIDAPSPSSSSSDARLELAVAAAASERANKPRWLIALGVALLAVTLIYALFAYNARAAILSKVKDERRSTDKIIGLKAQLDLENEKLAQRGTAPNPRMGQQIEQLAAAMNVVLAGPVSDSSNAAMTQLGLQQHTYNARCNNQDAGDVLKWLMAAMSALEMPGLEITRLVFRPGGPTSTNTPGWNVDITFSRWEKIK